MSLQAKIWASRLGLGWDFSLEAGILALRLVFEPQDWNLSLETGIGGDGGGEEGGGGGENSPYV